MKSIEKFFIGAFVIICVSSNAQQSKKQKGFVTSNEWSAYGRDAGGTRYSASNQINSGNVKSLKVAWIYQTGELKTYEGTRAIEKAAFEATPIVVDGTLYFSTPSCRVMAISAITGEEKWVYDPKVNLKKDFSEITSRGVSMWPAPGKASKSAAQKRIFIATIDGRLIGLDAKTGQPIQTFGNAGAVNLREGVGEDLSVTSPPAIIGNMVVVGSSLGDNDRIDYPRGTVRAYDALSGKLQWSWDPIPQDATDKAWNTWKSPHGHKAGAANAWSVISADAERDLVFIPTSCPSVDYYGGERLGQNLYGNSIVALRASTGKLVWYYQVVHHDIWDYDIAAQPMLIELKRDGKKIPAVAVGTKMGLIFILHRETGKPLFPVEERPVPASTVAGEDAWKTQPFPVLPAPLGLQSISTTHAWGLTKADTTEAVQRISRYLNKGPYTPPSLEGTLVTPGNVGGINWSGMCFDPKQDLLITNINWLAAIIRLIPREQMGQFEKEPDILRAERGRQRGTPYIMTRDYLFKIANFDMLMQTSPPWGTLVAIDLNNGSKKWEVPLGYQLDPKKYPGAEKWGSLNFGGAIVTGGNLIFVAATRDNHFRAFNTKTGELLWEYLLPASAQATPMTYQVNGKQFVVIAAGGHGKFKTRQGDYVVAFSIP